MSRSYVKYPTGGAETSTNEHYVGLGTSSNNAPISLFFQQVKPTDKQSNKAITTSSIIPNLEESIPNQIELEQHYYDLLLYILNSSVSYFDTFEGYQSYNLIRHDEFIQSLLNGSLANNDSNTVLADFDVFIKEYYQGYKDIKAKNIDNINNINNINDILPNFDNDSNDILPDFDNDSNEISGGGINIKKLIFDFCKKFIKRLQGKPNYPQIYDIEKNLDTLNEPVNSNVKRKPTPKEVNTLEDEAQDDAPNPLAAVLSQHIDNAEQIKKIKLIPIIKSTQRKPSSIPKLYNSNLDVNSDEELKKLLSNKGSNIASIETTIREINNSFPKPQKLSPNEITERHTEITKHMYNQSEIKLEFIDELYSSMRPVNAMTIVNHDTPDCNPIHTTIYLYYKNDNQYYFKQIEETERMFKQHAGKKKYTKRKGAKLRLKTIHSKRQRPPVSSNK
jgi:hypothetical protein